MNAAYARARTTRTPTCAVSGAMGTANTRTSASTPSQREAPVLLRKYTMLVCRVVDLITNNKFESFSFVNILYLADFDLN